jgi:hypothetical protein
VSQILSYLFSLFGPTAALSYHATLRPRTSHMPPPGSPGRPLSAYCASFRTIYYAVSGPTLHQSSAAQPQRGSLQLSPSLGLRKTLHRGGRAGYPRHLSLFTSTYTHNPHLPNPEQDSENSTVFFSLGLYISSSRGAESRPRAFHVRHPSVRPSTGDGRRQCQSHPSKRVVVNPSLHLSIHS